MRNEAVFPDLLVYSLPQQMTVLAGEGQGQRDEELF